MAAPEQDPGVDRGPDKENEAASSLAGLMARLGYRFGDAALLRRALTHSSSTADKYEDNERLEFFGDAVLDLIVCEYLYHACPWHREGELTEIKSVAVRRQTLAQAAEKLGLRPYLVLGKGIAGRQDLPPSVHANVFEAVLAAIYLDGGYLPARAFVLRNLRTVMDEALLQPHADNHKSLLQQHLQREARAVPIYRVTAESGPDHAKRFEVSALIEGVERGRGVGASKKEAEQAAAEQALQALLQEEGDPKGGAG